MNLNKQRGINPPLLGTVFLIKINTTINYINQLTNFFYHAYFKTNLNSQVYLSHQTFVV